VPVLGITGGIATGKSSFTRMLLGYRPAELFDADRCVHELLAGDATLHERLRAAFGDAIFAPDGALSRAALRDVVFEDDEARHLLEGLIHPLVRARWSAQADLARASGAWLLVDIPLLYETDAAAQFDRVAVVTCSPHTQVRRMRDQRGLASALIERMIATQLDLATKVARADHVVWNDSTSAALDEQARLLAAWLRQRYG
jgi:dephospho-CoA kinase